MSKDAVRDLIIATVVIIIVILNGASLEQV